MNIKRGLLGKPFAIALSLTVFLAAAVTATLCAPISGASSAGQIALKQTNATPASFGTVDPAVWHFVLSSKLEAQVTLISLTFKDAAGKAVEITTADGLAPAKNGGGNVNGWLVKTPGDWTLVSGYVAGSGLSGNFNLSGIGYGASVPASSTPASSSEPSVKEVSCEASFAVAVVNINGTRRAPVDGETFTFTLYKQDAGGNWTQKDTCTNTGAQASFTLKGSLSEIAGNYMVKQTAAGDGWMSLTPNGFTFTVADDGNGNAAASFNTSDPTFQMMCP